MAAIKNIVGPRVRDYRKKLGLTQADLSARLEIEGLHEMNRMVVSKIEAQIRCVNDYEIALLSKVLGVDSSMLLPPYNEVISNIENGRISVKRAKRITKNHH